MINEGDFILILDEKKHRYILRYEKNKVFHTHNGSIELKKIKKYGEIVKTSKGKPLYILRPVLSDFVFGVKRKTTILYPKDMGYMLVHGLIVGVKTIGEVGSGSGAFTALLSNIVKDDVKIITFEKRADFYKLAKENVKNFGKPKKVEFVLRDVINEGFGEYRFDTLFVDLPEPWLVVGHARESLNEGGSFVFLSPNFEQVKETVLKLKKKGFFVEKTVEILEREILVRDFGVRPKERMISHTGYITIARKIE